MVLRTLDEHIDISPGVLGGKPRIAGHRISVQDVVIWHYELEHPVEQIAGDYNLTLADVYAALAYYHDHKKEIDKSMKDGEKLVAQMKRKIPPKINKETMKKIEDIFEHELNAKELTLLKKSKKSHRKLVEGQW